jgi:hypothetical protein
VSFVDVRALEASGAALADLGGSVLGAGSDGLPSRVGGGAEGAVDAAGAATASRSGDVRVGVAIDVARSAASVLTAGCVMAAAAVSSPWWSGAVFCRTATYDPAPAASMTAASPTSAIGLVNISSPSS